MLYIKREENNSRSLIFTKNRRGESQQNLNFNLENGEMVYSLVDNIIKEKSTSKIEEMVSHPLTKIIGRSLVSLLSKEIGKKMKKH